MSKKPKQKKSLQKARLAYSVKRAGLILGVGKTSIYHLISTGALWTISIGERQMVPRSALEGFAKSGAKMRALTR